jgi:hypothetical protein
LFFIEDGRQIQEISPNMRQLRLVLTANANATLSEIRLDPQFTGSGFVYVGETERHDDGSREFRVVRYRLTNDATERMVLVVLPLPDRAGNAVFAIGSAGHLYVAVPGAEDERQKTESSGMLLRYNTDGTVPDDQDNHPVFATGYAKPTALSFDEKAARLWVAGVDDHNQPSVSSLGESTSTLSLPASSLASVSAADDNEYLFAVSNAGGFGRSLVGPNGALTTTWELTIGTGLFRSVAASPGGDVFVVVEEISVSGMTSSVIRLTSRR